MLTLLLWKSHSQIWLKHFKFWYIHFFIVYSNNKFGVWPHGLRPNAKTHGCCQKHHACVTTTINSSPHKAPTKKYMHMYIFHFEGTLHTIHLKMEIGLPQQRDDLPIFEHLIRQTFTLETRRGWWKCNIFYKVFSNVFATAPRLVVIQLANRCIREEFSTHKDFGSPWSIERDV